MTHTVRGLCMRGAVLAHVISASAIRENGMWREQCSHPDFCEGLGRWPAAMGSPLGSNPGTPVEMI